MNLSKHQQYGWWKTEALGLNTSLSSVEDTFAWQVLREYSDIKDSAERFAIGWTYFSGIIRIQARRKRVIGILLQDCRPHSRLRGMLCISCRTISMTTSVGEWKRYD